MSMLEVIYFKNKGEKDYNNACPINFIESSHSNLLLKRHFVFDSIWYFFENLIINYHRCLLEFKKILAMQQHLTTLVWDCVR